MFERPVLINPTRSSVDNAAMSTVEEFSTAVGTNTGNMAFLHAALTVVEGIQPISQRPFQDADVKVWGCANFIAPNREMKVTSSSIYDDGSPMVALGLGAQVPLSGEFFNIPLNTIEWIRKVRELAPGKAPNISVRGRHTYALLEANGLAEGCEALGCPSLFIASHRDLGARIREKLEGPARFFGFAPGNPQSKHPQCIQIENWMVRTLTRLGGSYLIQHPIEMLRVACGDARAQDPESLELIRAKLAGDMSLDAFLIWIKQHGRVFHDVPSWLFHNSGLDFIVSMRIHGAQMALQAGTPALVLAIDSRQVELCEIMKMPYLVMSDFAPEIGIEDLRARARAHDWAAYDENRLELAGRFVRFLEGNHLAPSAHLTGLIPSERSKRTVLGEYRKAMPKKTRDKC